MYNLNCFQSDSYILRRPAKKQKLYIIRSPRKNLLAKKWKLYYMPPQKKPDIFTALPTPGFAQKDKSAGGRELDILLMVAFCII